MAQRRTRRTIGLVMGGVCAVSAQLVCGAAYSDVQAEQTRPQMSVTRAQCIAAALRNNMDIQISQIDPIAAETSVMQAWGAYDPQLTGSFTMAEDKQPGGLIDIQGLSIQAPSSKTNFVRGALGLQGLIPTGTSYNLSYDTTRYKSYAGFFFGEANNEPAEYSGAVRLQLTQSLLRGLGLDVNLTQIRVAAANREVSELELMRVVMQTVSAVESAYWELVFARENLEVKKKSLVVAQDLLDRNQRKFALGDAARFLVAQAASGVATREAEIIAARATIRDAEDELKRVMNMPDVDEYWAAEVVPADRAEVIQREVDLDEEIRLACSLRPEILQARKNVEIAEMQEMHARNQALPQLDVFGTYGFNSRRRRYDEEIEYLVRGDDYSYSYGVTGSIPIGNRTAKAERIAAEHRLKQAKLRLKALEHNIGAEIRQAVRSVATNLRLADANRIAREFTETTLADEQTRFEIGLSTSYQVLEKEEDVAQARSSELRAIVNYRKAIVALDLADGTILRKNNIEIVSSDT